MSRIIKNRQRGAVLVVSLILLLALSIIGIGSIRGAVMEERMAGNLRDTSLAFQASESALRGAEAWLAAQAAAPDAECWSGCQVWALNAPAPFNDHGHGWWLSNAIAFDGSLPENNTPPRYVIEQRGFVADSLRSGQASPGGVYHYRVTARGTGGSDQAQVLLQSTFSRRY